jgi:hypothetical protein
MEKTQTYDAGEAEADADRDQQRADTADADHAITISVVGYPLESSPRYRVMYWGEVLIARSRVPIFDACRALVARGLTGSVGLYRNDRLDALVRDIAVGAQYTIEESAEVSMRLRRYVSYERERARTATNDFSVPDPIPEQTPILDADGAK